MSTPYSAYSRQSGSYHFVCGSTLTGVLRTTTRVMALTHWLGYCKHLNAHTGGPLLTKATGLNVVSFGLLVAFCADPEVVERCSA